MRDRRRGVRNGAVAVLGAGLLALATAGCTPDSELAELRLSAEGDGVLAEVWVPVNEPRSIGTYRVRLVLPGGRRDELEGERDGMLGEVWLEDLDGDSSPELVVGMTSAGSGSYGSVHVYSDDGRSYAPRELAALTEEQARGYLGHDVFDVAGGALWRSFPVYEDGDVNARPGGGTAVLVYSFDTNAWVATSGSGPESTRE